LGFLFFALPLAMVQALVEAIALTFKSRGCAWSFRLMGLVWVLTPLGQSIFSYASVWVSVLMIFLMVMSTRGCAYLFEKLQLKGQHHKWFNKGLVMVGMLLCLSPFLTHPVLHIAFKPKLYQEIDSMTLVRDWLLLNENGENWVNSWYYNFTAIAMERERITNFQPMVVALLDIDEAVWKNRLSAYFSTHKGQRMQYIKFIKVNEQEDFSEYINKGYVDFIAIGYQHKASSLARVAKCPVHSYAFFDPDPNAKIDDQHDITPKNFFGTKYERWGYIYQKTPLLLRKDEIQDEGYDYAQTKVLQRNKKALGKILSSPFTLGALLLVLLGGALIVLYHLLLFLLKLNPMLPSVIFMMVTPIWFPRLTSNCKFWTSLEVQNPKAKELIILQLNQLYAKPNAAGLEQILTQPMSSDMRIAMWQVACMGKGYSKSSREVKVEIVRWMNTVMTNYANYPFNFRYKIIEAAAQIPTLIESLDQLCKSEKHPYVRWYAESYGYGV